MSEKKLTELNTLRARVQALEAENEQLRCDLSQWRGLAELATDDLICERLHNIPALKAQPLQ